jgi:hypothetical protein
MNEYTSLVKYDSFMDEWFKKVEFLMDLVDIQKIPNNELNYLTRLNKRGDMLNYVSKLKA